MTFFEKLTAHIGGLVCLKTELYWTASRSYDGVEGRVCLLLDVQDFDLNRSWDGRTLMQSFDESKNCADTFLFIDGSYKLIWVSEATVELIK